MTRKNDEYYEPKPMDKVAMLVTFIGILAVVTAVIIGIWRVYR